MAIFVGCASLLHLPPKFSVMFTFTITGTEIGNCTKVVFRNTIIISVERCSFQFSDIKTPCPVVVKWIFKVMSPWTNKPETFFGKWWYINQLVSYLTKTQLDRQFVTRGGRCQNHFVYDISRGEKNIKIVCVNVEKQVDSGTISWIPDNNTIVFKSYYFH